MARGYSLLKADRLDPWLAQLMKEAGIRSLRQLALKAGVSPMTVSNCLAHGQDLGVTRAVAVARALNTTVEEMVDHGLFVQSHANSEKTLKSSV